MEQAEILVYTQLITSVIAIKINRVNSYCKNNFKTYV